MGRESIAYNDPRRYPFAIMNTAFGGGMSSRLFQEMREKAGLVYSVSSMFEFYEDIGLSVIYFVTDKENLKKCFEVLDAVLRGAQSDGFTSEELETARSYIRGNLLLGLESSTTRMTRLGRNEVLTRCVESVDETLALIDRVSLDDMNAVSREAIRPGTFCVAAVGPIEQGELEDLYRGTLLRP
jgi:predicted Zn-dependent peptidase